MSTFTDEVVVTYRSEVEAGLQRELALFNRTAQAQLAAASAIRTANESAAAGVATLVDRFAQLDRKAAEAAKRAEGAKIGQQFANVAGQLDPAIRAAAQYSQRVETLNKALAAGLIPSQREHARLLGLARAEYQSASTGAQTYAGSLGSLRGVLAGLGIALGARELRDYGEAAFNAFATMDRASRALSVATGSAGGAAREIAFLRAENDRLGVSMEGTIAGYGKFVVASTQAEISLADVREMYSGVATAASALGLSQTAVEYSFVALQQMASKGVVSMEELRRQLGDHVPGAMGIMARALDTNVGNLIKMIEAGDVASKDALPKFARELKKTYEEMARLGALSPTAQVNRLNNALFDLRVTAGTALAPVIGDLADDLAKLAADPETVRNFRELGEAMASLATTGAEGVGFLVEHLDELKIVVAAVVGFQVAKWGVAGATALAGMATQAAILRGVLFGIPGLLLAANQAVTNWINNANAAIDEMTRASREKLSLEFEVSLAIDAGDAETLDALQKDIETKALEATAALEEEKSKVAQLASAIVEARERVRRESEKPKTRVTDETGGVLEIEPAELAAARRALADLEQQHRQLVVAHGDGGAAVKFYRGQIDLLRGAVRLATKDTKEQADEQDKAAKKFASVTEDLRREIAAQVQLAGVLGQGETRYREVARAIAVASAEAKLHEKSTDGQRDAVRALAGELFDAEVALDDATAAMKIQREAADATSKSVGALERAQALLSAQMEGGDEAVEELSGRIADYEEAISRGMYVMVGWTQVLTAEGQALMARGAAVRAAGIAQDGLSEKQSAAIDISKAVTEAEYDMATAAERHRIIVEEGAVALAEYDLHLKALAETAAVFGREAAGLDMGAPTAEATDFYHDALERLRTEGKTALVESSNEAAKEGAAFYVATFSEAMSTLAREGWDNWEEVALDTIVKVIEFWEQQQASMRLQQATYGSAQQGASGTDAASSAGQAGAMSGSGWGAMIAAAIAFYQMMEARSAQNRAERFGTQISIGGRTFSSGYQGVATASAGQESPFEGYEARSMARQIEETLLAIVSSMGATVETLAHMNIQLRNDGKEFIVTVGDYVRTFDSLDEAIRHGIVEVLASSTIVGLSENMQRVIEAARRFGDDLPLEELEAMVEHAQRLDTLGLPAVVVEMRRAFEEFQAALRADERVGFGLDALRDELSQRLQDLGDSLRDELASFIPGADAMEQVERLHELGDAIRAHNEELARQAAAIHELTEQEEVLRHNRENPPAPPPGGWPDPGSPGGGGNFYYNDTGDRPDGPFGWAGFDTFNREAGYADDAAGEAGEAVGGLGKVMTDIIGPINEWNEGLPTPIELEELARATEALGATQEQQLSSLLLDHVRSGEIRARLQRAEHTLLVLELEARYAALVALGTLSDEVLNTYRRAIDDVAEGGGRRRRGGSGAGDARREAAEDFRQQALDVAAALAGATDSQLSYAAAVRELREQATAARIPAEELARAIADLAALELGEIAAPYRETALQAGEVDVETAMRLARERMETALADALARAAENPAAYADAVAAIRDGYAAEMEALANDALISLGDSALAFRLQAEEAAGSVRFLLDNLAALGLTAEQVANAVRQGTLPGLLDLIEAQAERVGDEELLADVQEQRREMELAFARVQFEAWVALLATASAIDPALQAIIDRARGLFDLPDLEDDGDDGASSIDDLRSRLAALTRSGISPTLAALTDWIDATAELRYRIDEVTETEEERAAALAEIDAAIYREQLNAASGLLDEIEAFLGVPLPVEMTQALAYAMFEVARAELLTALASEQLIAALTTAGVDVAELIRLVSGATLPPPGGGGSFSGTIPGMRSGTGGYGGGTGRGIDDLAAAREAIADFMTDLAGRSMHPLIEAVTELNGRFAELRDRLLAAGGSISELAALEALVAAERVRLVEEFDQDLRDLIESLRGSGDPSLSPAALFEAQKSEFDALVAAAASGDLEAREELAAALAEMVEAGGLYYGTATEDFQSFLEAILAQAEAVLASFPELPGIPPPGETPATIGGATTSGVLGQTIVGSGQAYYGEGPWYPPYVPPPPDSDEPFLKPVSLAVPPGGLEVNSRQLTDLLSSSQAVSSTLVMIHSRLQSIDSKISIGGWP